MTMTTKIITGPRIIIALVAIALGIALFFAMREHLMGRDRASFSP